MLSRKRVHTATVTELREQFRRIWLLEGERPRYWLVAKNSCKPVAEVVDTSREFRVPPPAGYLICSIAVSRLLSESPRDVAPGQGICSAAQ